MTDDPTTTTDPAPAAADKKAQKDDPKPKSNPVEIFCRKSGYDPEDVDGYNLKTRTFITTNGGKYQISTSGAVRRIQGPPYPKEELVP